MEKAKEKIVENPLMKVAELLRNNLITKFSIYYEMEFDRTRKLVNDLCEYFKSENQDFDERRFKEKVFE